MNIKKVNVKFDFDDILITPSVSTSINSRYEDINPYVMNDQHLGGLDKERLPIFTAPMDTVIDHNNIGDFQESGINVILPRTMKGRIGSGARPVFHSYGLHEFEKYYVNGHIDKHNVDGHPHFVLIDIANGHLKRVVELVKKAKERHPHLVIMAGNIANPKTYKWYAESGVIDYARIGIGNGNGCLTTQQTGVGYPKASLIRECYLEKQKIEADINDNWFFYEKHKSAMIKPTKPTTTKEYVTKIVADGGMKNYSDIIKALALGADYVMVGSIFNKALESAGTNYLYGIKIGTSFAEKMYEYGFPVKKIFYGMSTKLAQIRMGKTNIKTSEGVVRYRKVEYTLSQWVDNFQHYLRDAMSYTDSKTLEDFIGMVDFELITENAFHRFNK